MENLELQSIVNAHLEDFQMCKLKNQSLFHELSTSDTFPESVCLDHCYAKPWNLHPEADHVRPAKILFMKGILFNPIENVLPGEGLLDVETVDLKSHPAYDVARAKVTMKECERFANHNQEVAEIDDWEDKISRTLWSVPQKQIFDKVLKILKNERLALLAHHQNPNEPVLRRLSVDKMASRFRSLFGSVLWEETMLQWLHQTLCDHLPPYFLSQYFDVLQTLKSKIPSLIEKVLAGSKNLDQLQHLLKRPWDPISSYLSQHKVKRLPKNPLIVWVPGDPAYSCVGLSRRMKFWHSQLSNLGKLVTVNPQVSPGVTIGESLEAIITAVRYEVMELKLNFPNRPIILVGWTIGALIACQVALIEPITSIICLGFPLTGVNGSRGDLDDPLLENRTPTLFVIGQKANMCSVDDIEDFRERMRAESGLVVIGGADDHLRVCRLKKQLEGINQTIVDRCIVDEMYNFLSTILNHPHLSLDIPIEKVKIDPPKRKRKSANYDPTFPDPTIPVKKPRKQRTMVFPFINSLSGNISPSSPGSTTETSSTASSTGDSFMEKAMKTNGRNFKPQSTIGSVSLQNIEEAKRRKAMAPPSVAGVPNNFSAIDLPPQLPEKDDQQASFFSQQLGLPVISPSLGLTTNSLNLTTSSSSQSFTSQNNSASLPSTLPNVTSSSVTGTRLVLPKGNSPPGLSLNIGSLSSLSSFRQSQATVGQTSLLTTTSSKIIPANRNIRPKSNVFSTTHNPLFGKRLVPSQTTSSAILLATSKVVSSPQQMSNLSYLTMANPMLSNILGATLASSNPVPNMSLASRLPANIPVAKNPPLVEPQLDIVRTYMRTPQRVTTATCKTTTYVKAPPSRLNTNTSVLVPISSDKQPVQSSQSLISPKITNANVQATITSTKGTNARKLQVITFLKPPPVSNSNRESKVVVTKAPAVQAQTPSNKLSSPENASGALRLISSAIRVAEQKQNVANEETTTQNEKISLAQLSSDFQSEYLKNVCQQSPAVFTDAQHTPTEPQNILNEEDSIVVNLVPPLENQDVDAEPQEDVMQTFMMEPIENDAAPITFVTSTTGVVDAAITDRLSHLSAGTQEAILALTQLSELA